MKPDEVMQEYYWYIRKYRDSKQTEEDLYELLKLVANDYQWDGYTEGYETGKLHGT